MDRYAWVARLREGMLDEYVKRHDEIWPEMTQMLNEAGIYNYTIWNIDNMLVGYYECDDLSYALKYQAESEIDRAWSKYMLDVLEPYKTAEGKDPVVQQVFLHQGKQK